jgi:hypothetical protein
MMGKVENRCFVVSIKKSQVVIHQGFVPFKKPGQPVSRILSGGRPTWMDIYLG